MIQQLGIDASAYHPGGCALIELGSSRAAQCRGVAERGQAPVAVEIYVRTVGARNVVALSLAKPSEVAAAGELWRSRFDAERNLIIVNSGHRDFVFATRSRALQLRYLVRLYVKELVLRNFAGASAEQLAERMIELSLYVEDKLKTA